LSVLVSTPGPQSTKNSDTIGNRTCDRLACRAEPQPNAPRMYADFVHNILLGSTIKWTIWSNTKFDIQLVSVCRAFSVSKFYYSLLSTTSHYTKEAETTKPPQTYTDFYWMFWRLQWRSDREHYRSFWIRGEVKQLKYWWVDKYVERDL
jgi:hypothetical protein